MFTVGIFFFCPDGINPNSGLTGPNNTYTYSELVDFGESDKMIKNKLKNGWIKHLQWVQQ